MWCSTTFDILSKANSDAECSLLVLLSAHGPGRCNTKFTQHEWECAALSKLRVTSAGTLLRGSIKQMEWHIVGSPYTSFVGSLAAICFSLSLTSVSLFSFISSSVTKPANTCSCGNNQFVVSNGEENFSTPCAWNSNSFSKSNSLLTFMCLQICSFSSAFTLHTLSRQTLVSPSPMVLDRSSSSTTSKLLANLFPTAANLECSCSEYIGSGFAVEQTWVAGKTHLCYLLLHPL